ncbi:uncharacterized protein LOC125497692 [Beta vulgaris subsp. vulgaris]|uniref:uncharacterized protein LOC125497692 n=1 Tax=Beta vulgaris subsp. vulgaris TaxID=3555 RepID=UPI002036F659|nr:uncharacterized protein LOC125497692 [Beta vulgaris subsp. vulgaris]XP_048501312.1 uncharacterized protein LOC125497692 [Beta vulgaris subsp. vulgaris]
MKTAKLKLLLKILVLTGSVNLFMVLALGEDSEEAEGVVEVLVEVVWSGKHLRKATFVIGARFLVAADIPSLRKELEVSERKIGNLNKSFHAYSKVMKELTCIEIIVPVKNLLRKRVACRSLQSEFQAGQESFRSIIR